jgi:hypothetical protein
MEGWCGLGLLGGEDFEGPRRRRWMSDGGLVGVWVTNNRRLMDFVKVLPCPSRGPRVLRRRAAEHTGARPI